MESAQMAASDGTAYFLHIYAKPNSHQNKMEHWVVEAAKNLLQIRVMAPPENGKANKAIIALLAKVLGISKGNIILVRGSTRRHKIFKIEPWSDTLAQKLPKHTPLPTLF